MEKALYLQEPGDGSRIEASDIAQGQLGDCFFLSALGEIALKDPSYISHHLISPNGNGTQTVELYNASYGGAIYPDFPAPTSFSEKSVVVRDRFPSDAVNDFNIGDIVDGVKEIWPQVVEKAYAADLHGYFFLANGGYDQDAMETLTGKRAFHELASQTNLAQLYYFENSSSAIAAFDTPTFGALPYNLVADHSYMFDGVVKENGVNYVRLLNPWGFDQPDLIPVSAIGRTFTGITYGKV